MAEPLPDVLSASVDGICIFDRDHRCVAWSPAMERLTGIRAAEALGRTREELLPDDDRRTFSLAFSPASGGGLIGIARKTEASITELLSLASHKLKTPLTALQIQLGGQLRALQRPSPDLAALQRSAAAAMEQAMRLADTINMLVDVSRMDNGRWRLEVEDLDLSELARSTVDRLRHTAAQNGCEVRCDFTGDTHGRWDRARLEEVLATLLSNAFKHGTGKPIEVDLKGFDDRVELAVADHGAGMSHEEAARVFVRAPRTALGLWITREVVQAHHGTIAVETRPAAGTRFMVVLPKGPSL